MTASCDGWARPRPGSAAWGNASEWGAACHASDGRITRRARIPGRTAFAIVLALLASTSCSWNANAGPGSTELSGPSDVVPVAWNGNCPVVDVRIGSHGPFRFLLDTGAESTFLSPACAHEAGLVLEEVDIRIDAAGASSPHTLMRTEIDQLTLGSATFSNVPAIVAEMERSLDGVLGFPVFSDVLLTLDGPGRRLVLQHDRLPSPEADPACVVLVRGDLQYESPQVRGRLAGRPALILIDSGFDGSLYLARSIPDELGLAFVPDPERATEVQAFESRRSVVVGRLDETLELGVLRLDGLSTMVGMGPPVIVGGAVLRDVVTTFDQQTQRVRFSHAAH